MSTAFRPLGDPAVGWDWSDTLGYYIHRGYVYLNGVIFTTGDGTATQLLVTLPPEARPDSSIPLTLYATDEGTQYTKDVALQLPTSYAATIHTDGRLTLDGPLPPQVLVAPSIADYWFIDVNSTHFARYTQPLDLSLLLGNTRWRIGTPVVDEIPPTTSLTPFMAGGDFTNIDAGYVVHDERVHLVGTVRANIDSASALLNTMPADAIEGLSVSDQYDTLVHRSDDKFALYVFTNHSYLVEDPIKAIGDPPPVSFTAPPWQQHPVFADTDFGTTTLGQNEISGQLNGPGPTITPGVLNEVGPVDHGTYLCSGTPCFTPGGLPSLTLDLDALIASLDPLPEWFILRLFPEVETEHQANNGCSGSACGPVIAVDETIVVTTSTPAVYLKRDGSVAPWAAGNAYYLAPSSPLYTGATLLEPADLDHPPTDPQFLWQRGQITGSIEVAFSGTINKGGSNVQLVIYPCYEVRQHGLHAGDILDLADAGWVGVDPEFGIIPGNIGGGPLSRGIVRMR